MENRERLNIAIDGPAGAGKSTVAKAIAKELGIRYLDTGAMYRAMALYAKRCGVDCKDPEGMKSILDGADISVRFLDDGRQRVYIGKEDVTDSLRTQELGMGASNVGLHPPVRDKLAQLQRNVGKEYDVIMDGRETTTNVLPHTKFKFYMTASIQERAKRRYSELMKLGGTDKTIEEIEKEIAARDKNDMERAYMPLRIADDAIVVDTTEMTMDQVLKYMLKLIEDLRK